MNKDHVSLLGGTLTGTITTILLLGSILQLPVGAAAPTRATRLPAPPGSPKTAEIQIWDITCTHTGDCVAVGSYSPSQRPTSEIPVAVTESGGMWSSSRVIKLPAGGGWGGLSGVSCPSSGNCEAVGTYIAGAIARPFAVSQHSGIWARGVSVPDPGNATASFSSLNSVSCTKVAWCTAVGEYTSTSPRAQRGFIATDRAGSWTAAEARMPRDASRRGDSSLYSIACPPRGGCVAVGRYLGTSGYSYPVAFSESGASWRQGVPVPTPRNTAKTDMGGPTTLDAIACPTATTCVAGGGYETADGLEGFFVTDSNASWRSPVEARLPSGARKLRQNANVQSLACLTAAECVAGGAYMLAYNEQGSTAVTFTRDHGVWGAGVDAALPSGALQPLQQDSSADGVACPSPSHCEVVGTYLDPYAEGSFALTLAAAFSA